MNIRHPHQQGNTRRNSFPMDLDSASDKGVFWTEVLFLEALETLEIVELQESLQFVEKTLRIRPFSRDSGELRHWQLLEQEWLACIAILLKSIKLGPCLLPLPGGFQQAAHLSCTPHSRRWPSRKNNHAWKAPT